MRSTQDLFRLSEEALRVQIVYHQNEIFLAKSQLTQLRDQRKALAPPDEVAKSKKKKDKKDKKEKEKEKKKKSPQSLSDKQQKKTDEPKDAIKKINTEINNGKKSITQHEHAIIQIETVLAAKNFFAINEPAPVNLHLCNEYREFLASLANYHGNSDLIAAANNLKTYYENNSSDDAKKYLVAAKNILDDNSEAHRKALSDLITEDFNEAAGKWTKLSAIGSIILGVACVMAGIALFPVSILIPALFPLIAAAVALVPIGAGLIGAGQANLTFMANRIEIHETQTHYIKQFSVAANGMFAPKVEGDVSAMSLGTQLR